MHALANDPAIPAAVRRRQMIDLSKVVATLKEPAARERRSREVAELMGGNPLLRMR